MTESPRSPVQSLRHGRIAEIRIENPPVNALGQRVRMGLVEALDAAERDPEVGLVLITARGRLFSAGADINEFDRPSQPPHLPELVDRVEASALPIAIALHGTALGGALELALACHYRAAAPGAQLGLPEVKIGLLPGAGGTQRLPRVVGAEAALDMIVRGRAIPAADARRMGLVDELLSDEDVHAHALAWAMRLLDRGAGPRRTRDLQVDAPATLFAKARAALAGKPGTGAALACIAGVEAAVQLPFAAGLERERELFMACVVSDESVALRHLFFAERRAADVPGLAADAVPRAIRRVAVLGAGTMGSGIAMSLADGGLDVDLFDQSADALERARERIGGLYADAVKRGRIDAEEARRRNGRISAGVHEALSEVDLVIEAVFEDLALKQRLMADLDRRCKPGAILATNTSTLDVNAIAAATSRPRDVIGLHFFSPANVMRLLEIVRGVQTGDDVMVTALALARRLGKVGIVSGVCDGFIGNRMLEGYLRECGRLLLEGASPAQVDAALTGWGMAMGPFAMSDLAGIDIGHFARVQRGVDGSASPEYAVGERLFQLGRLGQKTGAGFYRYQPGTRMPLPDPVVDAIVAEEAVRFGVAPRAVSDGEIVERCVLPLVNEGARILEEGIALRAGDIDLVWLYGYGFPAFRGGPMHWANRQGLAQVLAALRRLDTGDPVWTPAPLLERLAREGGSFE